MITAWMTALLCLLALPAGEPVKTSHPPTLDGVIEAQWDRALIFSMTTVMPWRNFGKTPAKPTQGYLLYDDTFLYLAIECMEPEIKGLVTRGMKQRDLPADDDTVEIFLDPGRTGRTFYHFIVNPEAMVYDSRCTFDGYFGARNEDKSWNSHLLAATRKNEKSWVVELRIPWSDMVGSGRKGLPADGRWGVNVVRWEPRDRTAQGWARMIGTFYQIEKFQPLNFQIRPLDGTTPETK